jgi:hypothetical protein
LISGSKIFSNTFATAAAGVEEAFSQRQNAKLSFDKLIKCPFRSPGICPLENGVRIEYYLRICARQYGISNSARKADAFLIKSHFLTSA